LVLLLSLFLSPKLLLSFSPFLASFSFLFPIFPTSVSYVNTPHCHPHNIALDLFYLITGAVCNSCYKSSSIFSSHQT
jgi:hypothetical protein